MKLTKKIETEVLKVYDTWLHSYLNGDVETYDKYLDDDYHFIGSTDNEEFLTRKATTKFFADTAEQLAGKCELRNETRTLEQFGALIFITHLFDAWFLNGKDLTYYGRFRFTSALQKNKEGWRFIYQHFSTTDSKAQEGETIGFDQISAENLQLREAVKRRTLELEQKNRELEIETALEKVRARSLAMQSSDEFVETSDVMFVELEKLAINTLRIGICTINGKNGSAEIWSRSENKNQKETEILGIVPKGTHPVFDNMIKAWLKKKSFFTSTRKGKAVEVYYKKLAPHLSYPLPNSYNKEETISTFFFKEGSLNVVSLQPLIKSECDIMLRFSKVFGQIYQRFLDLQKAEAQARESEIELALERVRARTMGMQRSDELRDTAMLLFQQVEELGINSFACGFNIWDDNKKFATAWMAGKNRLQPPFKTNSNEDVYLLFHEAEKRGDALFVLEQKGKELEDHYKYMVSIPEVKALAKAGLSFPTFQIIHCAYFSKGYLMFITHESVPNAHDIFIRLAKVFEQTYTRFLDLQKAESQARESEIELALERVRARTMAMQHSDELQEASFLLDQQVRALGIKTWGCAFNIYGEKESTEWFGNEAGVLPTYTVPRAGIFNEYYKKGQKGESLIIKEFSGKACVDHYEYMSSLPVIGKVLKDLKKANNGFPTYQIDHVVYFRYGYLLFITKEHVPESYDIFKRFAKVFEQTYTRFLDLQKAEAQAREAQIETALEKVRSRSMAMHISEELLEVITVVSEQLQVLDFRFAHVSFANNDRRLNYKFWVSAKGLSKPMLFKIPYLDIPMMINVRAAQKQSIPFHTDTLTIKEHKQWHQHLLQHSGSKIFTKEENEFIMSRGISRSIAINPNIMLILANYASVPYSEADNKIIARFGQVFEQSYTRFLDLQKAEAQAREAQIETALERVRSRSMAMHISEELLEVITVVSEQLQLLNIKFHHASFANNNIKEDYKFWVFAKGIPKPLLFNIPHLNIPTMTNLRKAQKNGVPFFTDIVSEKEHRKWHRHLLNHGGDKVISKEINEYAMSRGMARSIAINPNIILIIANYASIPYSESENEIIARFGQVFEQSYTRFLDLQKAEAQAREAQIEIALERVRSRSIGMQKSHELAQVVLVLDEELIGLEIEVNGTQIITDFDNPKKNVTAWFGMKGQDFLERFHVPYFNHPMRKKIHSAWKRSVDFYTEKYSKTDKNKFFRLLFENSDFRRTPEERKIFIYDSPGLTRASVLSKNSILIFQRYRILDFSEEEVAIFKRFGKVFEQAYTRFLDLQKAEAQTREAQINLAVERVRAKALAMHKSEEIMQVVAKLKNEVMALDIPDVIAATIFLNEGDDKVRMWDLSSLEKDDNGYEIPFDITFKLKKTDPHLYVKRIWENTDDYFVDIQDEKGLKRIVTWLRENDKTQVADDVEEFTEASQLKQLYHAVKKLNNGKLAIDLLNPPTDEMKTILTKMGAAFDLAYKRFEDLQKAEAQTKEAQIEAALEKVRSRSLAMHKPDELQEVVAVVAEKLHELGVIYDAGGVILCTYFPNNKDVVHWIAVDDFSTSGRYLLPYFDNVIFNEAWDSKIRGDAYFSKEFPVEAKNHFFEYAFEHSDYKHMPKDYKKFVLKADQHRLSAAWSQNSAILIPSLTGAVPSENDAEIVKRFAKVFEQAYIRFMDLQVKEEQSLALLNEKKRLEKTLTNLKATQSQLIQSEKMASLGELTAGIAHEIQNPLNFVNNFSEVSNELIDEMNEEIKKGDLEEAIFIAKDIKQNLEKINHHGKRADAIVKGMLQHSRSSEGKKEPTDINKLADEYLRLAYHGLRAKDKNFNAELITDFDESIGLVYIVPQDIGRVILNLITNAFYAVNEKKQKNKNFKPIVSVSTKKTGDNLEVSISDNGNGIPKDIVNKIFQPFFTTKPTGQGTGLGLSMSYDIITKGHGGELKVKTKEKEGTKFTINLRIND